jgi:S1-C subfamily serine protease
MNKRWLWILIGVIALFVVLFSGAVAGAGLTYLALQARPAKAAREIILDTVNQGDYEAGVLVQHVDQDNPAAEAGIKRGDIILAVEGQQVNTILEVMESIEGKSSGDVVTFTIQHCETTQEVALHLEERNGHVYLGLQPSRTIIFNLRPFSRGPAPLQVDSPAFVITHVISDSPADEAGLNPGDLIIAIDGESFQSEDDLAEIIHANQPGDEITIRIWSPMFGDPRQVVVTLGESPQEDDLAYLGIEYIAVPDFSEEATEGEGFFHFEIPGSQEENPPFPQMPMDIMPFMHDFPELPEGVEQAVVINAVIEDSPAEKAGLEPGDLIISIDGDAISGSDSLAEIIHSLEPGDEITLTVYRSGDDDHLEIDVVLGEDPGVDGQAYLGVRISGFILFEQFGPSNDQQNPFHFDFHFPWQDKNWPPEHIDPIPGDDA